MYFSFLCFPSQLYESESICLSCYWFCIIASNIVFLSVNESLSCIPRFVLSYIWNLSNMFMCRPFLRMCKTFIASSVGPCVCHVFWIFWANVDVSLLFLIANICSLNVTLNVLPVCDIDFVFRSNVFRSEDAEMIILSRKKSYCQWRVTL
jgi:hypothetical protein